MEKKILELYNSKIKKEHKIAFISSFIISLMIHLYKFTNTLPNRDSLYNYHSVQDMLGSGRWALSWACGISSYYDLPWINGLMSCLFLALTVVVIVTLLKIKKPVLIILTGGLLAASPATTETFFFLYTADGYMIAMFLSALAVYLSRIDEKRIWYNIAAALCIYVSCGIYQAYVSFALILTICYFISALLQNSYSKTECVKYVFRQAIIYITALASYYIIWKLCLSLASTVANNYQGISEVGKISVNLLFNGLINSVKSTVWYFLQWDTIENFFTPYNVLSIIFLITFIVGIIVAFIKSKIYKRKWAVVWMILCLVAIIPFACIWHFTSKSVSYRAMMLQSLTLLFVLNAIIYEKWFSTKIKNLVYIFLIIVIFNNTLIANISYFYMNLCYERTYADGVEMMMEIHNLQDKYEFDKIAIVGNRIYSLKLNGYDKTNIHILSESLEHNLLYDSERTVRFLKATFGLDLTPLSVEQSNELLQTKEVRAMGWWPADDSITVIDDTLVIKLSDFEEVR